jgi:hypothetical protein
MTPLACDGEKGLRLRGGREPWNYAPQEGKYMINLPVSVLDGGFREDGAAARQSLADMVALARRAEQLGFLRFWVTEHHGSRIINGAAPPVIIARVAAETASIRVGAGASCCPITRQCRAGG